jgi:hypothetical protein
MLCSSNKLSNKTRRTEAFTVRHLVIEFLGISYEFRRGIGPSQGPAYVGETLPPRTLS